MKKLKTIRAGRLVRSVVYTASPQPKEPRLRRARHQITSAAQAKFNLAKSMEKLEALIALNFPDGFWWVTLTYDDAHLPEDRKAAGAIMRKYIRKLRGAWKLKGKDLLYIYCTQEVQDDGSLRLHHHMVLSAADGGKDDFDTIRALWEYGSNLYIEWQDSDEAVTDKATYMTHEPRDHGKPRPGEQTWTPCRGLKRPEVEVIDVPDEVTLEAPAGAATIERDGTRNEWGEFLFIKYWLPKPGQFCGPHFNPGGRY